VTAGSSKPETPTTTSNGQDRAEVAILIIHLCKNNHCIHALHLTEAPPGNNHLENERKERNNGPAPFYLPTFLPPPPIPIRAANHCTWLILTYFVFTDNTKGNEGEDHVTSDKTRKNWYVPWARYARSISKLIAGCVFRLGRK